jgi:hypothetical protein
MHVTPRAHDPLRHHVDRIIHAQTQVLLDQHLRHYELQTTGAEAIDVVVLAASVPCSVEKGFGDHVRHHRTKQTGLSRAVVSLEGEVRTVVHPHVRAWFSDSRRWSLG